MTELVFQGQDITKSMISRFSFPPPNGLTKIEVIGCRFTDPASFEAFTKLLLDNRDSLHTLKLDNTLLSNFQLSLINNFIVQSNALRTLTLSANELNFNVAKAWFLDALSKNSSLLHLDLTGNMIDDGVIQEFTESMQFCRLKSVLGDRKQQHHEVSTKVGNKTVTCDMDRAVNITIG